MFSANASIKILNTEKKSPYDVAILSENQQMIDLVNKQQSKLLLNRHISKFWQKKSYFN